VDKILTASEESCRLKNRKKIEVAGHGINVDKFKVQSSKLKVKNVRQYRNTPGTISQSVIKQVRVLRDRWFKDRHTQQLVIQGEEDLIALPSILLAPLDSIVLYGQYDLGVVVVKVTEEKKREAMNLLDKFDSG